MTEFRDLRGALRDKREGDVPSVALQCIRAGVVDSYGSIWNPKVFDRSLSERLPTLVWAHKWEDPIGRGVDYRSTAQGPIVEFHFSDFDAVPQARRAWSQVRDGTITDCSVGFSDSTKRAPTEGERSKYPGVTEVIEQATLDEVSLILRGAVPGAKVLASRKRPYREADDGRSSSAVDVGLEVALAQRANAADNAMLRVALADAREHFLDLCARELALGKIDYAEYRELTFLEDIP